MVLERDVWKEGMSMIMMIRHYGFPFENTGSATLVFTSMFHHCVLVH